MVDLPLEDLPYIWQVHLNTVFVLVSLEVHVAEVPSLAELVYG